MGNIFNDYARARGNRIGKAVEAELGKRQGQRTDLVSKEQGGLLEELPVNLPEVESGETREIAAKKAGFGNKDTYRQAKTVAHHATPELAQAMDQGRVAISTAARLTNDGAMHHCGCREPPRNHLRSMGRRSLGMRSGTFTGWSMLRK